MTDQGHTPGRRFHHREFGLDALLAAKERRGETVDVVIPALNEQGRVGHVVEVLRGALIDAVPLIDDLVVVDGGSTDGTASEARAAGARVVRQADVLPDLGDAPGKGEALWKGLAATRGDLVVFVDGDIVDIAPRFVTGIVGPLLTDPTISFAKAAYDRPLRLGDVTAPTGGGRVTELMARPLFGALWPELAWLAQPLSGEYGGRRQLLESLPFVQGYGVEVGLLIDIAQQYGSGVIAQVDLERREHDHQPLTALSRMAAEILHVALDRLARYDRAVLTDEPATELLQPRRSGARIVMDVHDVAPSERPALVTVRSPRGDCPER